MFCPRNTAFSKISGLSLFCLVDHSDLIARFCLSCLQNDSEDPLPRHDTVSGLPADSAVGVTFLADLRHLAQCGADREPSSHREGGKLYSFAENVFRESPRKQRERDLLLQTVHAFLCQQTNLPVPIAGMCVARNAVVRKELDALDRMLLLPFSFTDTYRKNDCLLIHAFLLLDKGIQKQYKLIYIVCQ